jgi:hypothetical protein
MHSDTHTTFQTATNVVPVPCNTHRYQGIYTRCCEERTGILDSRLSRTCEKSEAEDSGTFKYHHVDTALLVLVREESSTNGEETGNDVWGNGHELRFFGSITHVFDDAEIYVRVVFADGARLIHTLAGREK